VSHLSFSQWRSISTCPAAWHAEKVRGVYAPEPTEAMALGTLLHAAILPPHFTVAVIDNEPDLQTRKGPTAAAQRILAAAEYALTLPDVQTVLSGSEFEVPFAADFGGIEWAGRVDLVDRRGLIVDVKLASRGVNEYAWNDLARHRLHWTQDGLYWHQLALYRRLVDPDACVGLLAVQPSDRAHDVAIWLLEEAAYPWLDALADAMAASVQNPWTSPVTGVTLPPIAEMLANATGEGLARCEDCPWCRKSRTTHFRVFAPFLARE